MTVLYVLPILGAIEVRQCGYLATTTPLKRQSHRNLLFASVVFLLSFAGDGINTALVGWCVRTVRAIFQVFQELNFFL
jgi:hypothetical protein